MVGVPLPRCPELGVMPVTEGAVAALYVKWSLDPVADVPLGVVTVRSTVPAAWGGATGDLHGAITYLQRLLERREGQHFASLDPGLRGYKARHNLAGLCRKLGRAAEAETQWRAALAESPHFPPARSNLVFLLRQQGRIQEAIALEEMKNSTCRPTEEVSINLG
jgi:hypothetical protein